MPKLLRPRKALTLCESSITTTNLSVQTSVRTRRVHVRVVGSATARSVAFTWFLPSFTATCFAPCPLWSAEGAEAEADGGGGAAGAGGGGEGGACGGGGCGGGGARLRRGRPGGGGGGEGATGGKEGGGGGAGGWSGGLRRCRRALPRIAGGEFTSPLSTQLYGQIYGRSYGHLRSGGSVDLSRQKNRAKYKRASPEVDAVVSDRSPLSVESYVRSAKRDRKTDFFK
eukprot:1187100-Prorocentrum_minimum.AAC.3